MMKTDLKTLAAVAAALLATAAPALAQSQLIASAGLTAAAAQDMSLTEIAVAKFNRDADSDDRQTTVVPGSGGNSAQLAASAGLSPSEARGLSLTEIAIAKFNRDADSDDRQGVVRRGGVTMTSRSPRNASPSQLAASAGLSPSEAAGMSLTEIAIAKFNRDAASDDRQGF
jgi:hypothetical protein